MGSMNMPGISLTLLNLSNVSEECNIPASKLLEMLDAPHNSPAWPQTSGIYPLPQELKRSRKDAWVDIEKEEKVVKKGGKQILGMFSFFFYCFLFCPGFRLTNSGQLENEGSNEKSIRGCYYL